MSAALYTQTAYAEQEVYDRRVECDKRQEDEVSKGGRLQETAEVGKTR